jgi:hypothetical protein
MREQNCQSDRLPSSIPVIPLPVALYVSDGLIFELHNGGNHTGSLSFAGND